MLRLSRFVYGEQEFQTTISVRPFTPVDRTIGGSRTSAAGVPASYIVRRDAMIDLVVRIFEDEWTDFLNLLIWGQGAESIFWYPDAEDTLTFWEVYLESPMAGQDIRPNRDGNFQRVFEVPITLRGVGTEVPWRTYFELD